MIILGISEDFFDSGVTICEDTKILFMSNEERYTRRKNEGGFPYLSLQSALKFCGITMKDIDVVCVSGIVTPFPLFRLFPSLQKRAFESRRKREEKSWFKEITEWVVANNPISYWNPSESARKRLIYFWENIIRKRLPELRIKTPIFFAEHHEAHAWGSFFCSGFKEALIITADGMGDGLSITVSIGEGRSIKRLWSVNAKSSFGLFFENLTEVLGFVPCRDEGKLTGLSAHGKAENIKDPNPFSWNGETIVYLGPRGKRMKKWLGEMSDKYSREDLSAWAQKILEETFIRLVRMWVCRTGKRKICVAGGVFANVLLNMRIHEIEEVEELFVYPNMGDGGLSLGAVCSFLRPESQPLSHAFWGDSFDEMYIAKTLNNHKVVYRKLNPEDKYSLVADCLYKGMFVGLFNGRMEWGPRALGNRSILCNAYRLEDTQRLNQMLKRSDFMPFAPAMINEDVSQFLIGYEKARHAGEFMTCCFHCTQHMKLQHRPVVHIDDTARAQIVKREHNEHLYRILLEYKRLSGTSVVLNTSFNMHEEPIVRTPDEALKTFFSAGLDILLIEDFLVVKDNQIWQKIPLK